MRSLKSKWFVVAPLAVLLVVFFFALRSMAPKPEDLIEGFSTPESVAVGPDGRYYVSNVGQPGQPGDGAIKVVKDRVVEDLATGLDDPKGVVIWEEQLYVADIDRVWQISLSGQRELFIGPEDFPTPPRFLNDVAFAPSSDYLYISDTQLGIIFRVRACLCGGVRIFAERARFPELQGPNGLAFDREGNLLVIDFSTGKLLRITSDGSGEVIGEGFGGGDGLAIDAEGNLYISDYKGGKIFKRAPDGATEIIAQGLKAPADIAIDLERNLLLVPEFSGDRLRLIPLGD